MKTTRQVCPKNNRRLCPLCPRICTDVSIPLEMVLESPSQLRKREHDTFAPAEEHFLAYFQKNAVSIRAKSWEELCYTVQVSLEKDPGEKAVCLVEKGYQCWGIYKDTTSWVLMNPLCSCPQHCADVRAEACVDPKSEVYAPSDLKSCFEIIKSCQRDDEDFSDWQCVFCPASGSETWLPDDEQDVQGVVRGGATQP